MYPYQLNNEMSHLGWAGEQLKHNTNNAQRQWRENGNFGWH